jgi:hypothetical protein
MLTLALLGHALAADPVDAPVPAPPVEASPAEGVPLDAPPTAAMTIPPVPVLVPAALTDRDAPAEGDPAPVAGRLVLVPGVGWHAAPDRSVTGFSTGIVAHGHDLEGLDLQWAGSWLTGSMTGLQATMAYAVADDVHGLQTTLGVAWATGDVHLGQAGLGVNIAEGKVYGMQATAGLNVAGEGFEGFQGTAGLNIAGGTSEGVQASAGLNVADELAGLQAAPVNVADEVRGMQLGLVNVGRHVKGVQLGLVNIAETSDVSIAPINLVKDGLHRVDVWASESAMTTVAAKIGSKHVYAISGVGWVRPDQPWWTFGGGFGVHLQKDRVWGEVDGTAWGVADGLRLAPGWHNKLRGSVGFELAPALQPFVGLSMNGWYGTGQVWPRAVDIPSSRTSDRRYVAWPGAHVGISF